MCFFIDVTDNWSSLGGTGVQQYSTIHSCCSRVDAGAASKQSPFVRPYFFFFHSEEVPLSSIAPTSCPQHVQ